jgi:hypothetical protein
VSAAVSGGPLSVCGGLLPPHENFKLMKLIKSDARKPGKSYARLCVGGSEAAWWCVVWETKASFGVANAVIWKVKVKG